VILLSFEAASTDLYCSLLRLCIDGRSAPKPTQESISIQDALDIQNAAFMIPRAMTQIVQEGIEPLLIGEKLLQKIQYKPGMTTVFPAIEPLRADMAGDGMDLPQYNINIGGAQSFGVQVQRHGLRLKIAKRFVDESSYPVSRSRAAAGRQRACRGTRRRLLFGFITRCLRPVAPQQARACARGRRPCLRCAPVNSIGDDGRRFDGRTRGIPMGSE